MIFECTDVHHDTYDETGGQWAGCPRFGYRFEPVELAAGEHANPVVMHMPAPAAFVAGGRYLIAFHVVDDNAELAGDSPDPAEADPAPAYLQNRVRHVVDNLGLVATLLATLHMILDGIVT